MKIRPSLKLYFLIMMIVTGFTTISVMSVMSFNYFFTGIDFSMINSMRKQAYQFPIREGQVIKRNDFWIAKRWQDLPKAIKDNLAEQDLVEGELLKNVHGNPLFSPPKAGYFALKLNQNDEPRYIATLFHNPPIPIQADAPFPPFFYITFIAFAAMLIFALVPYFILRNVTTPVEKLTTWTKQLNKAQLTQPLPDFHYSELNSLAKIVQSSLHSVQESLDREQLFLGYASHELRTPIAVTRTNTELLRKMILKEVTPEKQLDVINRIERASLTMTDLTETLLWLNRQSNKSIPMQSVPIGRLTERLLKELAYLLNNKDVKICIETDTSTAQLPEALCQIVITNLIRNALQHTNEGLITIRQSGSVLIIINQEIGHENNRINNELGFGLGLELTERLVNHYGWSYKNHTTQDGHYVEIDFNAPSALNDLPNNDT